MSTTSEPRAQPTATLPMAAARRARRRRGPVAAAAVVAVARRPPALAPPRLERATHGQASEAEASLRGGRQDRRSAEQPPGGMRAPHLFERNVAQSPRGKSHAAGLNTGSIARNEPAFIYEVDAGVALGGTHPSRFAEVVFGPQSSAARRAGREQELADDPKYKGRHGIPSHKYGQSDPLIRGNFFAPLGEESKSASTWKSQVDEVLYGQDLDGSGDMAKMRADVENAPQYAGAAGVSSLRYAHTAPEHRVDTNTRIDTTYADEAGVKAARPHGGRAHPRAIGRRAAAVPKANRCPRRASPAGSTRSVRRARPARRAWRPCPTRVSTRLKRARPQPRRQPGACTGAAPLWPVMIRTCENSPDGGAGINDSRRTRGRESECERARDECCVRSRGGKMTTSEAEQHIGLSSSRNPGARVRARRTRPVSPSLCVVWR